MGGGRIKQVWRKYEDWEDFECGMWAKAAKEFEAEMIEKAIEFTGDHVKYGAAMMEVIFAWPNTMENSLTNSSVNYRAFIGHCAVMMKLGIPEYITRHAWKKLTDQQRYLADNEAEKAYRTWKAHYKKNLSQSDLLSQIM